ncbi:MULTISPECIES: hypothetical protein [Trichocoleus]|uniref:Uncharacterized protein n=1 Tax=Trichocoleus desertorum GB2-A4 TaxID=2933944 RepID=A0ABV0JH74_9CYAN|nr:hypothetical protein [Trichocoleus sp. FACHB-46]MBD1860049.1 hypothetical protein [Trichocoleus sp. FACHB-46]
MPRKPSLESLRATLQRLNLQQKQEIYAWLAEAIASEAEAALVIPLRLEAAVTEQRRYQDKAYQREKRRCNRAVANVWLEKWLMWGMGLTGMPTGKSREK